MPERKCACVAAPEAAINELLRLIGLKQPPIKHQTSDPPAKHGGQ